ncbi:MAG: ABC transporter family substrate-binding protein [Actinobacteria bacterium]|nr:ABC transporter family substrate-binding protein [Actinomycetota bacterium]
MSSRSRGRKFLTLLFVFLLVASACGKKNDNNAKGGNNTIQKGGGPAATSGDTLASLGSRKSGTQGGTLTLAGEQEPSGYNWLTSADNAAWTQYFMQNVWEGSVRVKPDGTIVRNDDIVSSIKLTKKDPLTIEYQINPSASWSNGDPVSVDDFKFTWEAQRGDKTTQKDPQTGEFIPKYDAVSTTGYEDIQSVEGTGKTVTVTFKKIFADWRVLFDPLLNRKMFQAEGGGDEAKGFNDGFKNENVKPSAIWSNGPFMVSEITPGQQTVLVRNPKYTGSRKAYLDKVTIRWITDASQEPAALKNGEVDVMYPQAQLDLVQQVKQISNAKYTLAFGTFWEHLDLNAKNQFLKDQKVRQAIFMAVDRPTLVNTIIKPFSSSAEQLNNRIFFPGNPNYKDNSGMYNKPNVAGAKKMLTDAGYQPNQITLNLAFRQPNPRRQQTVTLLQAQLAAIGIKVTITPKPDFTFLDNGDFDMALFGYTGGTVLSGNSSIYTRGSLQNYTNTGSAEIDRLIKQSNSELDPQKRADLWNQIDKLLWDQAGSLPMWQNPEIIAWNNKVKNVTFNGYQGFGWDMADWSF